jgi:hypothetical protein
MRFVRGHSLAHQWAGTVTANELQAHRDLWKTAGIDYGRCLCGCGQETGIASDTTRSRHKLKGEPVRYAYGHNPNCHRGDDYVLDENGCWVWQRAGGRYGRVTVNRRSLLAHRVMYERHVGAIPDGYVLHHRCENTRCCNPDHLQPMTPEDHSTLHAARLRKAS